MLKVKSFFISEWCYDSVTQYAYPGTRIVLS